jgi:pyrroline-5-carboxylate reductase
MTDNSATPHRSSPRIVFVGGGNMASALIGGLIARGTSPTSLQAIDPSASQREALAARFGITTEAASGDYVGQADVIVLAVKPQQMHEAVDALAPQIATQLIVSVAAGVRATDLSRWLGGYQRIVRTMPNTPALIGLGATGLAMLAGGSSADRMLAESIMQAVGQTVWVDDESMLDAVTALSGSGPAYVFRFIESMIAAGTTLGLSPEQSRQLALQTVSGAAQLASASTEPVSVLRERVTSKGGTTAAALAVFETHGLDAVVAQAMSAARDRSAALGDEFGK